MNEECFASVYNKALDIISRREHSEKEIKNKLLKKFDNAELIDEVISKLIKNNLINEDDEVVCMIKTFRGYTEYFPYIIEFKYGDDLYASCSMGFEDVII